MHSSLHAFCRQDQVYTLLDIVLDIEKLYPLISRHLEKRRQCFAGEFLSGISSGSQLHNWFSIT